jgi:16S rRNA (guanine966-N2)-methyltransferase
MRITGGKARGIPLTVPKGDAIRPATDALRQSVFSSIATRIPGAHILDLCAGSGAYGLEAISRGAATGIFVEKSPKAAVCLRANIAAVCKSAAHDARALYLAQCDLATWNPAPDASPIDLIFIDPPYENIDRIAPVFFAKLPAWLAASRDPLIVFEMPGARTPDAPPGWRHARRLGGKSPRQPAAILYLRE